MIVHHPDELSIQLPGQWPDRGAKPARCLRLIFASQITVDDNDMNACPKLLDFRLVAQGGIGLNCQAA
ncbi:hypothetical protein AWC06_03905 [Mycobacterium fragae]|uniref:Uncharacterized protein n=1 Tax=Mycobacterium fragae TaxID=1260918 RepID=A0A1X1UFG2_9MYCO|nr:hypothetical protein AWC06_03905 [Mycobacterium fragae]